MAYYSDAITTHLSQLSLHRQSSIIPDLHRETDDDTKDDEAKYNDAVKPSVQSTYISDSNADSDCSCSDSDSNEDDGAENDAKHGSFGQCWNCDFTLLFSRMVTSGMECRDCGFPN